MPIKLILKAVGATIALLCFAIALKALFELTQMNRAEKRERERRLRAEPDEETVEPLRRAG